MVKILNCLVEILQSYVQVFIEDQRRIGLIKFLHYLVDV